MLKGCMARESLETPAVDIAWELLHHHHYLGQSLTEEK